MTMIVTRPCPCGSGKSSWWLNDAKNIPVSRVCEDCEEKVKARYRPEIFTGYTQADVDEPIEEAD
jgi:hypothetical protein